MRSRPRSQGPGPFYPPVPTYDDAVAGGVIATNAAGAATFKYGSTRDWVHAITVVLANGQVLDLERGQTTAHPDGYFELVHGTHVTRITVPDYRMPDVAKRSAGYFSTPNMDLIDLFIGSEGTLGIVTESSFAVMPGPPGVHATRGVSTSPRSNTSTDGVWKFCGRTAPTAHTRCRSQPTQPWPCWHRSSCQRALSPRPKRPLPNRRRTERGSAGYSTRPTVPAGRPGRTPRPDRDCTARELTASDPVPGHSRGGT